MSEIGVEPGEFPFPLTDGPTESRYLTWVRNHSNYLAERGFLDYMRIVAVLVRGILVNFLTVLPFLLIAALLLALAYRTLLHEWAGRGDFFLIAASEGEGWTKSCQDLLGTKAPFLLTPWVAGFALIWYFLFPMVIRLFKVITYKKSLETGSDSSVKMRDKYELTFAFALLAVAAVAVIEALPLVIHLFHRAYRPHAGWRELIAMLGGGSSIVTLAAAGKLMSALDRFRTTLVMAAIGLLGLLLPLVIVLYVTEILIFPTEHMLTLDWRALVVVPTALAVGIVLAVGFGAFRGALKNVWWLSGYLAVALAIIAGLLLAKESLASAGWLASWIFVFALAVEIWLFCWLAVDVNLTSVHGFYRDRLAAAFLVGQDVAGDVDIEEDVDLQEICQYENGSTAPYHLVNVALNLQGSKDIGIRERNSDFFVFSKKFTGSERTGYCRSEAMEAIFPQMDLATAMAISAAAAAPNMGRGTSPPLVAVMTMLNIRLGYWVPNPGRLEPDKIAFPQVFAEERSQLRQRWEAAGTSERRLADREGPAAAHGLVGLAFSGGGIRSATLNLGITQALHARGAFDNVDYMSTVSGGGYLGSSISTLMRRKRPGDADASARASLRERFAWRVRPAAFLREMSSRLDEKHRWVNLSDGGHIENMAAIELLRRRCKYVVVGDGEADPELRFAGLATLIRFARIDLGIRIDIDLDALRLGDEGRSQSHFAVGRVRYPGETEDAYLLYLKSSFTGDEDEVVKQYRAEHPAFPHESTADQFFDEGQFEAYRALGQHIAEGALAYSAAGRMGYAELEAWFAELGRRAPNTPFRDVSEEPS